MYGCVCMCVCVYIYINVSIYIVSSFLHLTYTNSTMPGGGQRGREKKGNVNSADTPFHSRNITYAPESA